MPRLDLQLEVGPATESVNVSGAPPLLETETSGSGQVLDGDMLVKVPLTQKRAIRIMFYMPGANAIGGFTVLGQRARAMGYTVDGINGKEPGIGATNGTDAQISTTQDAFEEVKLYTTGAPAELGHSAGGLMSIVFKSGGNQFHGSAENRYISRQMIHRNYLEQLPRTNPFTYHETTFLFNGPVLLPRLYNGRDKTFWLAGWERHFENAGTSSMRTTVPTAEKGRSSTDIRNRFVSVMSYELPFGQGSKFLNAGGAADHVLGGWELTWTQTFQSGQPFTANFGGSANRYLPGESRPNILTTNEEAVNGNWTIGANRFPTQAQNPYLKFGSFAYPAAFTAGNLGRNTFEGPGLNWTQLSLAKWWRLTEKVRIQARLDANNFFPKKQPNYSNPAASFNTTNPLAFGRGFGTRGSFSDVGTSNSHILMVLRLQF